MKLFDYTVMIETLERWYQEAEDRKQSLLKDDIYSRTLPVRNNIDGFKTALWDAHSKLRRHVPDAANLEKWQAERDATCHMHPAAPHFAAQPDCKLEPLHEEQLNNRRPRSV